MDEIYYIIDIDARPWRKTPKIGATVPLALLFGAVVAFRQALNQSGPQNTSVLPDAKGAVATFCLVVFGMLLTKFIQQPWRDEYTKNVLLNIVYLGVISTGLYDAATLSHSTSQWLNTVPLTNIMHCMHSDFLRNLVVAMIVCAIGLFYIWLQTYLHMRAEAKEFEQRGAVSTLSSFREREMRSLDKIYFVYFLGAVSLITFLVTDFSNPIFLAPPSC
jgi:hypothetical protein